MGYDEEDYGEVLDDPQKVAARLIALLDEDVERLAKQLDETKSDADYEFSSRQLFRAFFAYVEGTIFSLKNFAAGQLQWMRLELDDGEWDAVREQQNRVDEKGEMRSQPLLLDLPRNLAFMLRLLGMTMGTGSPNFKGEPWWTDFKLSMKVRDRLMHPKQLEDAEILAEEIEAMFRAREGFIALLSGYLNAPPWTLGDIWLGQDRPPPFDPEVDAY